MKKLLALITIAACGGDDGGNPDGNNNVDTPVVPAMITVTGTATSRSLQGTAPVADMAIGAFKNSDEATPVVTATTDAAGMYTLVIPTGGMPVDGYIKATKTGFVDIYLYPPTPLVADFAGGSINALTTDNYGLSHTLCQAGAVDPSKGLIGVIVQDAAGTAVAGAKVEANPAATKYCYTNGTLPDGGAMMTAADGVALMFNTLGAETVSATKSGATFKSHGVKVFANSFTTTLITQ